MLAAGRSAVGRLVAGRSVVGWLAGDKTYNVRHMDDAEFPEICIFFYIITFVYF